MEILRKNRFIKIKLQKNEKDSYVRKKLRYTRKNSNSGSSDYAAFTYSSIKDRDLNHTQ